MGMSARRGRELEAERKRLESILPVELRHVFEESDIDLTWDFLHKVFHLNIEKLNLSTSLEGQAGIYPVLKFSCVSEENILSLR